MLIVIGAILIVCLVILHELGHFYAARKADVEVEEFGIGFPPRAKKLGKKNGTEYTLNWLPLGGFVRLKGEHDSDTTKGSFGAAKLSDKVRIMVAGVAVNAVIGILLLTVVAMAGLPRAIENQFTIASNETIVEDIVVASDVGENSPAESAGLEAGDTLVSIRQLGDCGNSCVYEEFKDANRLGDVTEFLAGKEVELQYQKRNSEQILSVTTTLNNQKVVEQSRADFNQCKDSGKTDCEPAIGYLGVVPSDYEEVKYTWAAPIVATGFSIQVVQETLKVFGQIIADIFRGSAETAKENAVGVVGIGYILGQLSSEGIISVLFLVGVMSLSLALMNILPIPALDGGRLFVTLLFRALRKPLSKDLEERIHGTGFAVLMVLFLLITVIDVQRFIL